MSGAIRGLIQTKYAGGAVANRRIVAFGSADNTAIQATASTNKFLGVSDLPLGASAATGEPFDVIRCDIAEVDYGGTITRGDRLTADSNGKAVSAEALFGEKTAVINGGSAGNLTVTGITTSDVLTAVLYYPVSDPLGDSSITTVTDLTSEFTITAADTINNTGGTATTNGRIEVRYRRRVSVIGTAEVSGVSGDVGSVYINIQVM